MWKFQKAKADEVQEIFDLIARRIKWMDEQGLQQWNATDYLHVYPIRHFMNYAESGWLYVLKEEERILGAVALLEADERWKERNDQDAYYVHHLVCDLDVHGAGREMIRESERVAAENGKTFLRLDCPFDNPVLNTYYESMGYEMCGTCVDGDYTGNLREKKLG